MSRLGLATGGETESTRSHVIGSAGDGGVGSAGGVDVASADGGVGAAGGVDVASTDGGESTAGGAEPALR